MMRKTAMRFSVLLGFKVHGTTNLHLLRRQENIWSGIMDEKALWLTLFYFSVFRFNIAKADMVYMDSCSDKLPMKPFDFPRYAGHWYVIGTIPLAGLDQTRDLTCVQSEYELIQGPAFKILHTYICKEKRDHTFFLKTWAQPSYNSDEGKLLTISLSTNDFTVMSPALILDTDYENYAIEYVCSKVMRLLEHYVTIYSRRPVLDEPYRLKVEATLTTHGFNASRILLMEQDCGATDCTEAGKCLDTAKLLAEL